MKVTLTVTGGPHAGESFAFEEHDAFIVGRSTDAQFRLPFKDKTLSRVHFMVEVNPPGCRLMDMASTNGTFVNGRRVSTVDLADGDSVRGGKTTLSVSIVNDLTQTYHKTAEMPSEVGAAEPPAPKPKDGPPEIPRYRIERELGRGGMGVVYLAHGSDGGGPVALKTICPSVSAGEGAVARFLREASILRKLDHPRIVRFREVGHAAGLLFFAMEYVPGMNVAELLRAEKKPMTVGRAVDLVGQAIEGLAYAHATGFVHRDIKPHNLLVYRDDAKRERVKLADFGLARLHQNSPLSGLTLTGQVGGTSGYMAPEQITNFREAKPPADQYGLAALLYYLLTAAKPYNFPVRVDLQLLMILQEEPVPIRTRRPDLPEPLARIIHRALARDPASRYPDVEAFRADLMPFAATR